MLNIAIDGPSGAGKSTLAKALAKKLGITYLDTGALYRSVGLAAKLAGVAPDDREAIAALIKTTDLRVELEGGEQVVYLNGEAVGERIRTPEMSTYASKVSAIPEVRAALLGTQRDFAGRNPVIMDGRDIGTVVLPDANVKFFVTVRLETRARRRFDELVAKGIKTTYDEVLADMKARDLADSTREISPAVKAEDAIELDNSDELEAVISRALAIIEERTS